MFRGEDPTERAVLPIRLRFLEQGLGSVVFMGEDQSLEVVEDHRPEERYRGGDCADPELPGFQHDDPNGLPLVVLVLDFRDELPLRPGEVSTGLVVDRER